MDTVVEQPIFQRVDAVNPTVSFIAGDSDGETLAAIETGEAGNRLYFAASADDAERIAQLWTLTANAIRRGGGG